MQISVSIEPYLGLDISLLTQYIEKIVKISKSLPGLSLHFDYFVENPKVLDLVKSYCQEIDIYTHLMDLEVGLADFKVVSKDVKDVKAITSPRQGIVFDLGCEINGYEDLIKSCRYVTIMTVKCGKSGQVFNAVALDLVAKIKAINPQTIVTIDGGVNETNIKMLKKAGVDIAVVGNYAKKCYEKGELFEGLNRLLRA